MYNGLFKWLLGASIILVLIFYSFKILFYAVVIAAIAWFGITSISYIKGAYAEFASDTRECQKTGYVEPYSSVKNSSPGSPGKDSHGK